MTDIAATSGLESVPGKSLVYRRADCGSLVIVASAVEAMLSYRQHLAGDAEAGGVLLGMLVIERPDRIVEVATSPTASDLRSRLRFFRAKTPTQKAIELAWKVSGGGRNYLGEWHTHPENVPVPSGVDLDNWRRLARTAQYEQESLFFVIVGLTAISAWEVSRGTGNVSALPQECGGTHEP